MKRTFHRKKRAPKVWDTTTFTAAQLEEPAHISLAEVLEQYDELARDCLVRRGVLAPNFQVEIGPAPYYAVTVIPGDQKAQAVLDAAKLALDPAHVAIRIAAHVNAVKELVNRNDSAGAALVAMWTHDLVRDFKHAALYEHIQRTGAGKLNQSSSGGKAKHEAAKSDLDARNNAIRRWFASQTKSGSALQFAYEAEQTRRNREARKGKTTEPTKAQLWPAFAQALNVQKKKVTKI